MTSDDGLHEWQDGRAWSGDETDGSKDSEGVNLTAAQIAGRHLWAIMPTVVHHAAEHCSFGQKLHDKVIKHTNLTAGRPAHCAGELVLLSASRVVLNGRSGRYGPQSPAELEAVATAFKASGYEVFSMGWDDDANLPAPFLGKQAMRA